MIGKLRIEDLKQFLILAKKNTYAGDGVRSEPKCILSKNYLYEEGDFRYEDQYFGEYLDVGEEIVWYDKIPVWGMGYRGGMIDEYIKEAEIRRAVFNLLSKALLLPPIDFPARGPINYEEGNIKYINSYNGTICDFVGKEEIFYDGRVVYKRNYLGGLIYGKRNLEMLLEK